MALSKKSRRHALGQHFLASEGVLDKIIHVIDPRPGDLVVEIGAGRGALTFPLARRAGRVVAIEKDAVLAAALESEAPPNVEVVAADVLTLDLRTVARDRRAHSDATKVVGNLPYAISGRLLFKLIDERAGFDTAVFLVQKEVAARACGKPGSKDYAPVSILLDLFFTATVRLVVHPGSFVPPPKVESALISIAKKPAPKFALADDAAFARFLQAAFRQRRKTLFNNLAAVERDQARLKAVFAAEKIDRSARPEETDLGRFVELFKALGPNGLS